MFRTILLLTTAAVILYSESGWTQIPDIPINKPECIVWDSLYNRYLVSLNIDNDIVQVDRDGVVTMFRENVGSYITSAGISDTIFFQSDVNKIIGFDLATGNTIWFKSLFDATYISAACADSSGYIYVPDMPSRTNPGQPDLIWKIRIFDGSLSTLITTDEGLGFHPRDIVFDPVQNRLIVTFMKEPVYIQSISLNDLTVTNLARFKTDYTNGIARDQFGNIYVAGYDTGIIYRYDPAFSSEPEIVSEGHNSPCNIDYNPQDHILAVPCYWGNVLQFLPIGRPEFQEINCTDQTGGDGDGRFESGEIIEISVTMTNTHFLPLTDVSINFISITGAPTIFQDSLNIGSVPARSDITTNGNNLTFRIPDEIENQNISIQLEITYTSDYELEKDTLVIEETMFSCCGEYTFGFAGNSNCDSDGLRDLADITRLIDNVYISREDLCCILNGNINGDGAGLINLADITKLIDHVYITKAPTAGCE